MLNLENLYISPNLMTFILIAGLAQVFAVYWTGRNKFRSTDVITELEIIDAKKQKEFGQLTAKVKCGIFIKNFSEFNLQKNTIIADLVVWFSFNSDEVMLSTISQFSFDNGDVMQKSEPDIKIDGKKTFAEFSAKVALKANLNFHNFPLEGHKIPLILTNNFVTPQEMFFVVDAGSFGVSDGIFISDWAIKDLDVEVGFSQSVLDKNDPRKNSARPKASFILTVVSRGIRRFLVIFLPILLVSILSLASFVAALTSFQQRQILSTTAISAMISYRFVIENMLPPVGYFTTTDNFYIFILAIIFAIFIFQTIYCWHAEKRLKNEKSESKVAQSTIFYNFLNTLFFLIFWTLTTFGTTLILI